MLKRFWQWLSGPSFDELVEAEMQRFLAAGMTTDGARELATKVVNDRLEEDWQDRQW